jgi:hypothetical protein
MTATNPKPLSPPEARFWRTYSPNGEFPFSSIGSFTIHLVALLILLGGAFALFSHNENPHDDGGIETVMWPGPPGPLGGGGKVNGDGNDSGIAGRPRDVEQSLTRPDPKQNYVQTPEIAVTPNSSAANRIKEDPDGDKTKVKGSKSAPLVGPPLVGSFLGNPSKGKQGPGKHGGDGPGDGPFKGPDSSGTDSWQRQQRWRMYFTTTNGNDYLRQLSALGAIIRVDQDDRSYFIRNLNERPAKPLLEDPNAVTGIYWSDEDPSSITTVTETLRLSWTPDRFYIYFPKSFETRLLQKELEYGKIYGRKTEQDIAETHFKIEFARGAPVITVIFQEENDYSRGKM